LAHRPVKRYRKERPTFAQQHPQPKVVEADAPTEAAGHAKVFAQLGGCRFAVFRGVDAVA
jgi:hypothetical protein